MRVLSRLTISSTVGTKDLIMGNTSPENDTKKKVARSLWALLGNAIPSSQWHTDSTIAVQL